MYMLAKFQFHILKAFEVIALQSNSNTEIDLYSKHRENKLQTLPKTGVTYKWSKVRIRILHHHVCHELRNGLLGKLFNVFQCFILKNLYCAIMLVFADPVTYFLEAHQCVINTEQRVLHMHRYAIPLVQGKQTSGLYQPLSSVSSIIVYTETSTIK